MINATNKSLPNYLFDIADNIQIKPNFCVKHRDYKSFGLPSTVAERFGQTSETIQNKYLTLLLRNLLYGIYYNGSLPNLLAMEAITDSYPLHNNLENNSFYQIDWQFYEKLHENNRGHGYFDENWQVVRREPDGSLAVTKDCLTLHIEYEHESVPPTEFAQVDEPIAIWMPKNRMQNGFYIALSNMSSGNNNSEAGKIYFNITADGAIALMDSLSSELNQAQIPFTFGVLYNKAAYERFDSGILNFERHDYPVVRKILQKIYQQHQSHFAPEIPLFTKYLAPGLGLAEEPEQKFVAQESFGMNRCQIIANALLEAWYENIDSPSIRVNLIREHFERMGIDLQYPYLNPDSTDTYEALN
ncbi:MAG: T3SS effector HopA1 family protein [Mastigocoleus sp.]